MKKIYLNAIALGLVIGSPLSANLAVSTSSDFLATLSELYKDSGMDSSSVSDDDVVGVLPSDDRKAIYVFWKNPTSDVNSFNLSSSLVKDSSSVTGYAEKYVDSKATLIGKVSGDVSAYSCPLSYTDRVFIRQVDGYSSKPYPVSKVFYFTSDSVDSKAYKTINVTDKLTSFFNVTDGDSNYFTSLFNSNPVLYQEHYIAFNLDTDIDSLLNVRIQSYFDDYSGNTSYVLSDVNGNKWQKDNVDTGCKADSSLDYSKDYSGYLGAMAFNKNTISDFKSNLDSALFLDSPVKESVSTYDVVPKKKAFKSVFGDILANGSYVYNFNTIMDLENTTDLKKQLSDSLGSATATALGKDLIGDDGKPKFRWFVNYSENKVPYSYYCRSWNYHLGNSGGCASNEYYCSIGHCLSIGDTANPYRIARQASIIQVSYTKNGVDYKSLVVDTPKDSTGDPTDPLNPGSSTSNKDKGLEDWQIAVLVVIALAMVAVLGIVIKPVGAVLKYVFKAILFVIELAIEIVYICLVWWWFALLCVISKKPVPKLWFWKS